MKLFWYLLLAVVLGMILSACQESQPAVTPQPSDPEPAAESAANADVVFVKAVQDSDGS